MSAATACAVSLSVYGQDSQNRVRVGDTDVRPSVQVDANRSAVGLADNSSAIGHDMMVSKANKASSLIGMDVRNSQNEKLGEIKDLVVDLSSGKIAYAVLSVGGFLGIGDKYVAVPPSAFHAGPDQNNLVLNADKAKIQNAPGFAKTSWPELNSATWTADSAYWLTDNSAQGTIGTTRTGTDTARSTSDLDPTRSGEAANADRSSTLRQDTDRTDRTLGTTVTDRQTFRGRITAINPESRTVSVEGPAGSREFKLTERPTLTLKENRNPSLTDFKVGYPVTVGYHEENGTFMAHSLIRSDSPEVR